MDWKKPKSINRNLAEAVSLLEALLSEVKAADEKLSEVALITIVEAAEEVGSKSGK